eukprot:CAMPEP_0117483530 /NCGR_PEP_ID=MMETSP0784-20121206/13984_1 /TAXON_ID=39447 /ORGANISM="" /LENGTH=218 /DNA_ID=CAMNT_0005278063 /DNA_START=53 /DNA_END=709 /DNA_ORIENTATION=-
MAQRATNSSTTALTCKPLRNSCPVSSSLRACAIGARFVRCRQEKLELRGKLLFAVKAVGEIDPADPAIRVNLHAQGLNVVRPVGTPREVRQIELDLVPTLVQTHGHRADEGLDTGGALVVRRAETASDLLVVQDLDLEREVLLEILDDHDEEGQLDPERLVRIRGACQVGRAHVRTHDLEHARLDVSVREPLDVAIAHLLVPDLKGLAADRIQYRQEP